MHCLIVDDDELICDLLKHFCSKTDEIRSTTVTNSGFESINLLNQNAFEIIFLDYNLPDINGQEILEVVPADTAVVMVTSHTDFAAKTYNYEQVVDFLVKPLDFERFYQSIRKAERYISSLRSLHDQIFVKEGNKLVKISLNEVLYFKAEANYISVVMHNRRVLILMTLKVLQGKLPSFFQRVHRSYIVNINKVDVILVNMVKIGETEIPVSNTYEKKLLEKINLLD